MHIQTQPVETINHPYVSDAFLKTQFDLKGNQKDILVLETVVPSDPKLAARQENQEILEDLFLDLPLLREQAEKQVDRIDSIHIRSYN